ncbi:rod shape-determining protein MreD [Pseudogemmobacter blasticus]|uniref:Rod shape-determining protein MreD n=1 Tax=Fuscovulum blasticum DSM 2131 TaxID=1188250 RepID=A0A2T4J719_FUSBL|nr:rod shape-determining protein MreD [Fuscovulum blasticum]AWD23391.1 rod shape-determining protein MreD [Fuscovulum blasticum]PTE13702.1 rod shape-determining protein MreD [Fuscovulum blasticum DSM 2131]
MDRLLRADPWGYRALFLALALLLLFIRLLPLGNTAGALPGPDLMLCLTFAWVMRRPDYLPLGMIVAVTLAEDLILMRPPGLWTALMVLATEFLRSRNALTRELSFVVEWLLAAGLMLAMLLAYRFAFAASFLPQPPFGHALVQILWSILAYPLVVGLSRLSFDLRKPATGEIDDYGRRL